MNPKEPVQEFFSIGEVCSMTDLKPHVLRYWESQFRFLSPAKNRSGNRVYQRREVELVMLVKHLLYDEKYTIDGARQKIEEQRKGGRIKGTARSALNTGALEGLEHELELLLGILTNGNQQKR
jgi:DNA-binding transcriptional MerR regulator